MFDALIAALDGDTDQVREMVTDRTGGDPEVLAELCGVLLRMILSMAEETNGSTDVVRERLRELAVLAALQGITG